MKLLLLPTSDASVVALTVQRLIDTEKRSLVGEYLRMKRRLTLQPCLFNIQHESSLQQRSPVFSPVIRLFMHILSICVSSFALSNCCLFVSGFLDCFQDP